MNFGEGIVLRNIICYTTNHSFMEAVLLHAPTTHRILRLVTDYYQGVARAQLHIEALDEPL